MNVHRHRLSWGALLLFAVAPAAHALEAIVLEVRELTMGGMPVADVSARLDVLSDRKTRVTLTAASATLPEPAGRMTNIRLVCNTPVIAEPRFACDSGRLSARGGPTGAIDINLRAGFNTDTGVTTFSGDGLRVAGAAASFSGSLDERGWQARGKTTPTTIGAVRKFAKPWFELPAGLTVEGKVEVDGAASDRGQGMQIEAAARLTDVELTNEESTIVGEKVAASAQVTARPGARGATVLDVKLSGTQGQALLGPVLLDLGVNPLDVDFAGALRKNELAIESLRVRQKDLMDLSGSGRVNLAAKTPSLTGKFQLAKLEFPAAYTSYLQITLAASALGDLQTSGTLSGDLAIVGNTVTELRARLAALELHDRKDRLHLSRLTGDVSWAPVGGADARISKLAWSSGGAYGLSGGAAQIEFVLYGMNFALAKPTKLPVFDGALAIETLALGNLGADDMEVSFKGEVEPISMPLLAKAFGWPEFSGTLAASIPGIRLKDDVLTFDGNVESQVFGGTISGSNIRLQDPLGNFPQFFADVRARDLDLELVTRTFEVGSITGRLEADVLGLELFAWSPVAFDARLETPAGDESRHRISAKAVSSLSNVGGGGGGVVQALQSGVLRFFDEYSYEKLGLRCKLKGDVCLMSGVEPAPNGYYIVKGSGLPRIDIVGNAGRVSWNQLMSSISNANFSEASVE